jgi:hypothetical protein
MSQPQDIRVPDALAVVPDPRGARGKRYPWLLLRTLLAADRASGQQTAHTPAHWLRRRAADLTGVLPLRARRRRPGGGAGTPHDAADRTTPLGARWQALAVAATTRPAAIACGAPTHLVSLVRHGSGTTIGHGAVGENAARCAPSRGC